MTRHTPLVAALTSLLAIAATATPSLAQAIIFVDDDAATGGDGTSWASAFFDLQSAIDEAQLLLLTEPSVEIWVAAGTYTPREQPNAAPNNALPRDVAFSLIERVEIYGGFAGFETVRAVRDPSFNRTILSGDLAGNDPFIGGPNREENAYTVVYANGVDSSAVLDGVVITAGNADHTGPECAAIGACRLSSGGGMVIENGATPTLEGCIFFGNHATDNGGGLFVNYEQGPDPDLDLRRCSFLSNTVGTFATSGVGHAALIARAPDATGHTFIYNCLFAGNGETPFPNASATLDVRGGSADVVQCTIAFNRGFAGLSTACSPTIVVNTIVVDTFSQTDPPFDIFVAAAGGATIFRCAIESPRVGGPGLIDLDPKDNIEDDPGFVVPFGMDGQEGTLDDDYRLESASPLIDAGDTANAEANEPDLGGRERVFDGDSNGSAIVDIGAYEFGAPIIEPFVLFVDADAAPGGDGFSWERAFRHPIDAIWAANDFIELQGREAVEVWIAEGTYMPDGGFINDQGFTRGKESDDPFDLSNGISLVGGFAGFESSPAERIRGANTTTISGDLEGNDTIAGGPVGQNQQTLIVITQEQFTPPLITIDGITFADAADFNPFTTSGQPVIRIEQLQSVDVEIVGCTFTRINGPQAIDVRAQESSVLLVECDFFGISRPAFHANSSVIQASQASNVILSNCRIFDNQVTNATNAGLISCDGLSTMTVVNSLIYNNRSQRVFVLRGGFQIVGSTVWGNDLLGNGVLFDLSTSSSRGRLANTLVWDNDILSGNLVNIASPSGSLDVDHCLVQNASVELTDLNTTVTGPLLQVDPLVVDRNGPDGMPGTIDDDFSLGAASPAADAGSNAALLLFDFGDIDNDADDEELIAYDPFDADGDGVLFEPTPLDFAGQPRRSDVESIPDTGNGNAPIVDIGAFEVPSCENCPGERFWQNALGGAFETPANWFPGVAGIGNAAVFDLDAVYAVSFTRDVENFSLRALRGDITFDLGGFDYSLNAVVEPPVVIGEAAGDDAALTLRNGRLLADTLDIGFAEGAVGSLTVDGAFADLEITDDIVAGFAGDGSLTVSNGASAFALAIDVGARARSTGRLTITDPGTFVDVPFIVSVSNGTLAIENDAMLRVGIGLFGGVVLFDGGTLTGNGTVDGSVVNFGDVFPGAGPSTARGLTITGDYVQLGTLEETGEITGSLRVRAGGLPSAPTSDALTVLGDADIAGGLVVEFDDAFDPGDQPIGSIPTLDASSVTGRFDVAFMPAVPPDAQGTGRFLRVEYPVSPSSGERGAVSVDLVVDTLTGEIATDSAQNFDVNGSPVAAAIDDLNGDGDPDLAVAIPNGTALGQAVILLNAGTDGAGNWQGFGTTIQLSVGVDPQGIDIGNFDATGGLDIAVANAGDGTVQIFSNDGAFAPSIGSAGVMSVGNAPKSVVFGNLDNDKWDDLAVAVSGDDEVRVFADQGGALYSMASSTALATGAEPVSLVVSNLDNDKWDDLAVATLTGNTIDRFFNSGGGVINPVAASSPVGDGPMQLIAADLDLDDLPDLATANMRGNSVSVLRSTGSGAFSPAVNLPVGTTPRSIAAVNLDPDEVGQSDLDLAVVVSDGTTSVIEVLRNDYDAANDQLIFAPATTLTAGGNPTLVLPNDLNGDGQDDLVTVNDESANRLLARGTTPMSDVSALLQSSASAGCPGDADGNGLTQTADLTFVISNLGAGTAGATGTPGDVNGDGLTTTDDVTFVVSNLACGS